MRESSVAVKTPPRLPSGEGIYLYGIVEGGGDGAVDAMGVDGESPLRFVSAEGLAAVVSAHRGDGFASLPRERLVRSLLAHQQGVERAMEDRAILPAKFATLLEDESQVAALLSQGLSSFGAALSYYRDKAEMEVAATWDAGKVLREVGQEPEVAHARAAHFGDSQPSLEARVSVGRAVKAGLDRRRREYQEQMEGFLRPWAVRLAPNVMVSEEMVMNVAFLVERARLEDFHKAVARMDRHFADEIAFRVVGPLPPYSFATVEVARITAEEIEAARLGLGLTEAFSEREVRRAYRRLAAAAQGQDRPEVGLAALRRAKELLVRCCRSGDTAWREPGSGPSGNGLFVINIKGQRSEEVEPGCFGAALEL